MTTKTCPRCHETKTLDQYGKRGASPDGLQHACKICINAAAAKKREDPEARDKHAAGERERRKTPKAQEAAAERRARPEQREKARQRTATWREENPEKAAETGANYRVAHRDEANKRTADWKDANPERVQEGQADWYIRNADKKKAQVAEYRVENAELLTQKRIENAAQKKLYDQEYARINADLMRMKTQRRRARLKNAAFYPFTRKQLAAKMAYWGDKCWVCGGPVEAVDHVKPLSKGGAHMLCNFRPICKSDNSAKGTKWPLPDRESLLALRRLRNRDTI